MNKRIIALTLLLSCPLMFGADKTASTTQPNQPSYLKTLEINLKDNTQKVGQAIESKYEQAKAALPELQEKVSQRYQELKNKLWQTKENLTAAHPELTGTLEKAKAKISDFKERVLKDAQLIEQYRKENGHLPTPAEFKAYKESLPKPSLLEVQK